MTHDSIDEKDELATWHSSPIDEDATIDRGEVALLRRLRESRRATPDPDDDTSTTTTGTGSSASSANAAGDDHSGGRLSASEVEDDPDTDRTVSRSELDALRRLRVTPISEPTPSSAEDAEEDRPESVSPAPMSAPAPTATADAPSDGVAAPRPESVAASPVVTRSSITTDEDDGDRTISRDELAERRRRAARKALTRAEARQLFEEESATAPDGYFRHADTIPYATLRAMRDSAASADGEGRAPLAAHTPAHDTSSIAEPNESPDMLGVDTTATQSIGIPLPAAELPRDVADDIIEPSSANTTGQATWADEDDLAEPRTSPSLADTAHAMAVPEHVERAETTDPATASTPKRATGAPRITAIRIVIAAAVVLAVIIVILGWPLLARSWDSSDRPVPMNTSSAPAASEPMPAGDGPDTGTDA